jgi:uncharacterized protein YjbJ (UPF0337 family)
VFMPTATSRSGTARTARPASSGAAKTGPKRTSTPKAATKTASRTTSAAKEQTTRTASRATKAGGQVANVATGQGKKVAGQAKEQAREVASTAAEKGGALVETAKSDARSLAGTVRSRAGDVTGELSAQTRSLAEETRSQIQGQVETGALRLAVAFQELGEEAQALAEGRPEDAPRLSNYVFSAADRAYAAADRLHSLADDVQERGFSGVLDDVQSFARRRPGAFLLGAAVVGFGVGRLVKAGKDDEEEDSYELASSNGQRNGQSSSRMRTGELAPQARALPRAGR